MLAIADYEVSETLIYMIKKIFWREIREQVAKLAPEFSVVIDELDPSDDHYLYSVEYPYGAVIVDHGIFQVPNSSNHIVPINHPTVPIKIKEDLSYSGTIPFGLISKNSIETFLDRNNRIIPASLISAGGFISLWRVLDEGPSYHTGKFWNITSGVRSICMTPKITDTKSHKKLKTAFNLTQNVPQELSAHWDLFVSIANHHTFPYPWHSTLIFFPKSWFEHKKDKSWLNFYHFLYNYVWQKSNFRRNQFIFDFAFSIAQEVRGLRPNPYLADTVRHLISIGSGAMPCFAPAIDENTAPIHGLQQIYLKVYELKKYAPVILVAHHYSSIEKKIGYYSFQIPPTAIFSPRSRKIRSTMNDIQETNHIMDILLSELLKGNLEVENTPLHTLAQNVKYAFYHSNIDKSGIIVPASEISKLDNNFTSTLVNKENYIFPQFSPFFKGCVALSSVSRS